MARSLAAVLTTILRRRSAAVIAAGVLALGIGFATDHHVAAAAIVETTPPDTTPVTTPDTVAPDTNPDNGSDDDNGVWFLLLILIVALIIGVIAIISALNRRDPRPTTTAADNAREQRNVMNAAQWFQGTLAPQLIVEPPDQALQRWGAERRRVESVIAASQLQAKGPDDPWALLSQSVVELTTALDQLIGLRAQRPPDPAAIADSAAVTNHRRDQLGSVLTTMWPMVNGY